MATSVPATDQVGEIDRALAGPVRGEAAWAVSSPASPPHPAAPHCR
ncbi:hypothetical protein [Streptomyces sp. NPDC101165]